MTSETQRETHARHELVELVRLDYDSTRSLIAGVVQTSSALRGLGLTLTIALLGFATEASSLPVALCGLGAVFVFGYLDAYHGWLYAEAVRRAHQLERVLTLRYKQLERAGVDTDIGLDLELALTNHRFGQYSNMPRFKIAYLLRARPRAIYLGLYGSLAVLAVIAAVYAGVT